jgi:hypothetical protein
MKNEHVQISLQLYNELRDFKEAISNDEMCILTEYVGGPIITYTSKDEANKILINRIHEEGKINGELNIKLSMMESELNDQQITTEWKFERMSIWQFIKWRNKQRI